MGSCYKKDGCRIGPKVQTNWGSLKLEASLSSHDNFLFLQRGHRFDSKHPHEDSQPSLTPVPGVQYRLLTPTQELFMHLVFRTRAGKASIHRRLSFEIFNMVNF